MLDLPIRYSAYRSAFLAVLAVILFGLGYFTFTRPTRPGGVLGMRGLARQHALLHHPLWATLEPLVRWVAIRIEGLVAPARLRLLEQRLTHAGDLLGLRAEELLACSLLSGLVGGGLGLAVGISREVPPSGSALLGGVGVLVTVLLPGVLLDAARANRMKTIHRRLPYAIDLMALSMSAGLDFPSSLLEVVRKAKVDDALNREIAFILHQLNLGHTRAQALRMFLERTPSEPVREFVHALVAAEERGHAIASVLEIQASTARTMMMDRMFGGGP